MARKKGRQSTGDLRGPTDSGQVARVGLALDVDFHLASSEGDFRGRGVSASAAFRPFGGSDELTDSLVRDEILPASAEVTAFAGTMVSAPTSSIESRLDRRTE